LMSQADNYPSALPLNQNGFVGKEIS